MKPLLPIVCLSRDDVSLALEHWFCTRYDIGFLAVIDHRFLEDGSATLLVVGLGSEERTRKNLSVRAVGESIQLWQ